MGGSSFLVSAAQKLQFESWLVHPASFCRWQRRLRCSILWDTWLCLSSLRHRIRRLDLSCVLEEQPRFKLVVVVNTMYLMLTLRRFTRKQFRGTVEILPRELSLQSSS